MQVDVRQIPLRTNVRVEDNAARASLFPSIYTIGIGASDHPRVIAIAANTTIAAMINLNRNNTLPDSVLEVSFQKGRTMNKLAFAALGLLARAGKSLAALTRHETATSVVARKKGKVTHKTRRGPGGTAKLR
jgi:hypothetical protein